MQSVGIYPGFVYDAGGFEFQLLVTRMFWTGSRFQEQASLRGFIFEQAVRTHSTEIDAFSFRIIFLEDIKGFSLIRLVFLHILSCLVSPVEVLKC